MLTQAAIPELSGNPLSAIEFKDSQTVVIAFSGGGDSTALLLLAHQHFSKTGDLTRLLAVTVDHGLRPESAGEAKYAADICADLDIVHRTCVWEGAKPATGLQNAAREARYHLLADVARAAGAEIVLTGHTLDDQLETIAMRSARGPGRGLSGIAPATLFERQTWFVRPLLKVRRMVLRTYLQNRGRGWIDDPSNTDEKFERVRVRGRSLHGDTGDGIRDGFNARHALSIAAAEIIRDSRSFEFDTEARTAVVQTASADDGAAFRHALAIVMSWVGQGAHLASRDIVEKAAVFCFAALPGKRMTVAGCLLRKTAKTVRIERETRNRRETGYGFDKLLPSPDFPAAQALAERIGQAVYPNPPVRGYLD